MRGYGQYCPIAVAAEVLGERWTILIVRELLLGARRFAEIDRGLPGIPRAILAKRLAALSRTGLVTKQRDGGYELTPAGEGLRVAVDALGEWGARHSFGDPARDQLRPDLLMWWIRRSVRREHLPQRRVVIRFDLHGARGASYWLLCERGEVELCKEAPGFDEDAVIRADTLALHRVYGGRLTLTRALREGGVAIEAQAAGLRSIQRWLGLSSFAATARAAAH